MGPVHEVQFTGPFLIGKHEVTFAEYDRFALATWRKLPDDQGWGRDDRPVINVTWDDTAAYAKWLREETGKAYRLPTEAEWEYAARGETNTDYWWGDDIQQKGETWANCIGCSSERDLNQTALVGSFDANPFGLHDTAGNVWEWVKDCWHENYDGAPADGSAWEEKANAAGVSCAVAPGPTYRGSSARPPATGTVPTTGTLPRFPSRPGPPDPVSFALLPLPVRGSE